MVDRGLVEVRGKTPEKSLYGLIYRKDKARQERGQQPIFKKIRKGSSVLYTLNK
jgi:hypothetical protein